MSASPKSLLLASSLAAVVALPCFVEAGDAHAQTPRRRALRSRLPRLHEQADAAGHRGRPQRVHARQALLR